MAAKPGSASDEARDPQPSNDQRVSYRVIARHVGLSRQAVALALRNAPGVSKATREKIQEGARLLGYKPQPAMAALMREMRLHPSKRQVVKMAFLNCWGQPFLKSKAEPLRDFYLGAKARALALGYLVEVFEVDAASGDFSRLDRALRMSGVDGILVFPTYQPIGDLRLEWKNYAVVEVGQQIQSVPLPFVVAHHAANMTVLCQKLLSTGHRKIGFIHGKHVNQRVGGAYLGAFLTAAWPDHRESFVEPLVADVIDREVVLAYLKKHRCDALIVGSHFNLGWLEAAYRVPQDISIASFSLFEDEQKVEMSGINEMSKHVGEVAAEHLARRIQANERGLPGVREVVMVPGLWCEGTTMGNRNNLKAEL